MGEKQKKCFIPGANGTTYCNESCQAWTNGECKLVNLTTALTDFLKSQILEKIA